MGPVSAWTAGDLLAQRVQRGQLCRPRVILEKLDVIANAVGRPETDDGVGCYPLLLDDAFEKILRVVEQLLGFGAALLSLRICG